MKPNSSFIRSFNIIVLRPKSLKRVRRTIIHHKIKWRRQNTIWLQKIVQIALIIGLQIRKSNFHLFLHHRIQRHRNRENKLKHCTKETDEEAWILLNKGTKRTNQDIWLTILSYLPPYQQVSHEPSYTFHQKQISKFTYV